jgi:hypothetical protein
MALISKDKDDLMVKCSCYSHVIEFHFDDYDKECVPSIDIAIWSLGQRPLKLRWRDRLRWVYYLLKDGELHGDDVILNEKDADSIVEFLTEKSKVIKERIQEFEKNRVK